jgi:hypothetical protein
MTRHTKTPKQRAEEQLGVAERLVKKLGTQKTKLRTQLDAVTREHDAAVVRRDYLKAHPDLQQQPTTASTGATP